MIGSPTGRKKGAGDMIIYFRGKLAMTTKLEGKYNTRKTRIRSNKRMNKKLEEKKEKKSNLEYNKRMNKK